MKFNLFANKTRVFIFLFIIIGITLVGYLTTQNYQSRVVVNGKTYNVAVSDTSYTKMKGLSGKTSLAQNQGMIFVFEEPGIEGFWMKDMNFPIDIIWIDENLAVNHIEKSVSPATYPTILYPESKAKYVLEVSAGQSDVIGLKLGDKIEFYK